MQMVATTPVVVAMAAFQDGIGLAVDFYRAAGLGMVREPKFPQRLGRLAEENLGRDGFRCHRTQEQ